LPSPVSKAGAFSTAHTTPALPLHTDQTQEWTIPGIVHSKFPRFAGLWQEVQGSLWAVPLLVALGGAALAFVVLNVDPGFINLPAGWLFGGRDGAAPQFLSSLVNSVMTVSTLVISITMVVLTLAAQQLGSRIIHSFMSDLRTQLSLGLFVATIVYLLLVLRGSYGAGQSVPNLAVTVGTVLVLLTILVLPLYVHHLARSIIADNMIERVGAALDSAALALLPERSRPDRDPHHADREDGAVRLEQGGYVQAIDYDTLVRCAQECGGVVSLMHAAGDHVLPGEVAARIAPATARSDQLAGKVRDSIVLGSEPTAVQDLEFSVRQLVEIALRGISSDVRDYYTTLGVLDRLALSLAHIMHRAPAESSWRDDDGDVRVLGPKRGFERILDHSFGVIRKRGGQFPALVAAAAEKLRQLASIAPEEHRAAVEKHFRLMQAAAGNEAANGEAPGDGAGEPDTAPTVVPLGSDQSYRLRSADASSP
jgi:uncharacterized membrane protein